MLLSEFKQKYPNLISEFLQKNPGRRAFMKNDFTKSFLDWLQQRNIKITYKYTKFKSYNHISEFFLNFLKEHTYFSKNLLVGIYKDKIHPSVDEYKEIKKEFGELIHHHLKYGVLEKFSRDTYKINKYE